MEDSSRQLRSNSKPDVLKTKQLSLNSLPSMKQKGKLARNVRGPKKLAYVGDLLAEDTVLQYRWKKEGKDDIYGVVTNGFIVCTCCDEQVTPTEFEKHVGFESRRKPYHNILTPEGESLADLRNSKHLQLTLGKNNDMCTICSGAEALFWCKKCRQAFHAECVGLSSIPEETWCCAKCRNIYQKVRLQDHFGNATKVGEAQHRVDTTGLLKYDDVGSCAICNCHDFTDEGFNDRTIIICDQCQKEYHIGCLREKEIVDLKEVPKGDWFCCEQCRNINSTLSRLIEDGEQNLSEYLLYVLKKKYEMQALNINQPLNIKWRVLRGKDANKPTMKLLADAVSIFRNQFGPIYDSSTTKTDLIKYMVHGTQFGDHNYNGMYCAILMVKSVVVSAALFRIFGEELAEVPLVATKKGFEDKGYFRSLFFSLEDLLVSQNVKTIVLPAAIDFESIWKFGFWFVKANAEQVEKYENSHHQMVTFEKTSIMHKVPGAE